MILLDYGAWFLAFLSCLLYGKSVRQGASCGVISALLFIVWGTIREIPPAVITNVGFLFVNSFNLYRSFNVKSVP